MVRAAWRNLWVRRAMFVALGLGVVIGTLLPGQGGSGYFAPDLVLCVILVWLLRAPEEAPPLAIAFVAVFADILQQHPIGLHAALVLAASEFARTQVWRRGETGFAGEWGIAAFAILAIAIAERAVLSLALVPLPGFGATALYVLGTAIAYPLVAVALWVFPRVRVPDPGEVQYGRRYGA